MCPNSPHHDEIEISLEGTTELELTAVEIDSEEPPLEFSVDGQIRDIDSDLFGELQGTELKPVAVRFERLSTSE